MSSSQNTFKEQFEQYFPVVPSYTTWILLTFTITLILTAIIRFVVLKPIKRKRIPGPKIHPMLSTLVPLINVLRNNTASRGMLMFQVICGYSHVFRQDGMWMFWGGLKPILMLFNPETVEPVLNSNEILQKGFEYDFLAKWLKEGLLTSTGDKWRYRRKLLTPAFHFRILDEYIPIFNEQANMFAKKLRELMKTEKWVDIGPLASLCTLDIICETAMGKKINAQNNSSSPYVQALHTSCKAAVDRIIQPWLWLDSIYYRTKLGKEFRKMLNIMDSFTRQVVAERKAEKVAQMNGKDFRDVEVDTSDLSIGRKSRKRLALLDLLLDVHFREPNNFTLEDIAEEVDNFMFAGHDTTSSGLSFALYMLGLRPDIQTKVQEEVDEVMGDDLDRPIQIEDLKELKYLECVLKETRRLFPPTPFIARELHCDTEINGYTIPKGTSVGVLIHMLHRHPGVFPNPEVFDPERFTLENSSGRHPFAYVPFSAGPRNCIGQRFATFEALIVIATIVRHFNIKSRDPLDKIHMVDEIVLRSESGLKLQFTPRGEEKDCDAMNNIQSQISKGP